MSVDITAQLDRIRAQLVEQLDLSRESATLFFSVTDGKNRAITFIANDTNFNSAWSRGCNELSAVIKTYQINRSWLRVDMIQAVKEITLGLYGQHLTKVKRNYSRKGISFDSKFNSAITEQELNANALLYNGDQLSFAKINPNNFQVFFSKRFPGQKTPNLDDLNTPIYIFTTTGSFDDGEQAYPLKPHGRNTGYRYIKEFSPPLVKELVTNSSNYLAGEVHSSGQFTYGHFPCFGREINFYNNLRHASSTYAMIEAFELNPSPLLKDAINRAIHYLTSELIHTKQLENHSTAAFLIDKNNEIKLGGNAVSILALSQYSTAFNTDQYYPLMEQLADGLISMQDANTGKFVHVLSASDLSVKDDFRIIYYDGEAAFSLIRLYGLTKNERWINSVVKAFDYFIEAKHWTAHDHWLSYCVNELTLYKPEERYFRFGIDNVQHHLDFVANRITTFPTLLELMMATQKMLSRLDNLKEFHFLLDNFDTEKFYSALHSRARYLLNGYFWPEMAMFFKYPDSIVNSFFIRHHSFRVRIDDVEHYLSGLIAYFKYIESIPGKLEKEILVDDHPKFRT